MEGERIFTQAKEIKKENPLLRGPEKVIEKTRAMDFGFSFDTRKFDLMHSPNGSFIHIECYQALPESLTEDERKKFTKIRKQVDGIEQDVFILDIGTTPKKEEKFEEDVENNKKPKSYCITKKRDFSNAGFIRFADDDKNIKVYADIVLRNSNFTLEKSLEIAKTIFDNHRNGKGSEGLLDEEIFKKVRLEVAKVIEKPSPVEMDIEKVCEILKSKKVLFYTGAGISVAGGVYGMQDLEKSLRLDGLRNSDELIMLAVSEPEKALKPWDDFANAAFENGPTIAHSALTRLAEKLQCKIFTENVDHLHEKTGIQALRPTGDWLKENIQPSWLKEIDAIITVGLSSDDRGMLAWYKENNPNGKLIAINLVQPNFVGEEDYLLKGDLQDILPELEKMV
ncbi:MAG: hypothetical protein US63_C0002G0022 [Candidatus Moranbacteria bacterium GW2011_GWC2_37_8]|nr:MAG: hypothetical protein US63_C0002G0022 [Candidatus Moranbacteria bacterium GW2011_GWC2_37_8]KKQ62732.1 MAG: hypothetical protein US82_C0007G0022 [Parcubacteria group bacterium GW2011_GWC1_38_22]